MPRITLLDPTKTGRQAEDLEDKLRHFVVGQEEAIHEIVSLPDSPGGTVSGRPADRKSSVPGTDGLRKDSHRRGNRRVPAEEFSSGNQGRLRGVSTQP
jgi:hypothetical protein